jgi:hypothetical protein
MSINSWLSKEVTLPLNMITRLFDLVYLVVYSVHPG